MKTIGTIITTLALVGIIAVAVAALATKPMDQANPVKTSPELSARYTRSAGLVAGGGTAVASTNANSVSFGPLTAWSRYVLQCTDDTWVRSGATAPTAASGDLYIPKHAWWDFVALPDALYFAVRNKNLDGDCAYQEIQ